MDFALVECLRCGHRRRLVQSAFRLSDGDECPRCRYVGWAPSAQLTEPARRALRDAPVELRHLRVA